ncbi:MAG TPA: hypothetical protein VF530_07675 [Planctomycetota bacterium]
MIDSLGRPVPGATVEHFGLAAALPDNGESGIGPERAQRFFHRSYTTQDDGTTRVAAFGGEQVLLAERGSESTSPWRGSWQAEVVLELRPSFEIGGSVTMPDVPDDPERERRLVIAAQTRNLWRELVTIRDVKSGSWGPVTVPCVDAQRYRVRLEGPPVVPVEVEFAPPAPGSSLRKDLVAEIGDELWFKVMDMQGQVIPTAQVRAFWADPQQPQVLRFAEASRTKEDQIGIVSVPRGSFTYEAWAPGYAWVRYGPHETSICATAHLRTELERAGVLRGKVRHQGQPVQDFEILVWQPAGDRRPRAQTFLDRADGAFEIDSMPAGEFWVTASSQRTPGCEPVVVTSTPGGVTEITLELVDGLRGRGRVVDQDTQLPLPQASVQLFVKGDVSPAARWGLPIPVEPDGTFDVGGYMPGQNFIRALAEGYSSRVVTYTVEPDGIVEWGDIALGRSQAFTIRVEPPERGAGASVATVGQTELPPQPFSADGVAVYPAVNGGNYGVNITEEDGTRTFVELDLVPGEDWTLRTRLGGPNRLSVRAVEDGRSAMARVDMVDVIYVASSGLRTWRLKAPSGNDSVEFEGIDATSFLVMVGCTDGTTTTVSGTFDGTHTTIDVPLRGLPFQIRVVDPDGEPIPDVRIVLTDPDQPALYLLGGTDADGECTLQGVPEKRVTIHLMHGTHGSRLGVPVEAVERSVELILDAPARLELAFQDGAVVLAGVKCNLNRFVSSDSFSDGQGRLTFTDLAPGGYPLRATRPDCWPAEFVGTASVEGTLQTIQIRRLGDLELHVTTAEGVPMRGLPIQLHCQDLDADVREWMEAGRVPAVELVTDEDGLLRIARLPRGSYRWRAEGPSGLSEGVLEVMAAHGVPVRIALP